MSVSNQRIGAGTVIVSLFVLVGSGVERRPVARANGLHAVVSADERTACGQGTVLSTYGFQGQWSLGLGTPQPNLAAEMRAATADGVGNPAGRF
jgi:hypothetical protein